jgi:acetoin:2,6-dichlorophenolindophenol oxidoreductase subunit beta
VKTLRYFEAINQAVREEMHRDPRVIVMGEDLRLAITGFSGGLYEEFGPERVLNTPLSENGFVGAGVGAAMVGLRPVVDIMIASFIWMAMDQLVNQAAKNRYLFGGQAQVPIVFRFPMMIHACGAAHHTDRPYPSLLNVPGLKIVCPTTAYNAKGLWKTAIRDDDPVCIFEDMSGFSERSEVPDEEYLLPFGRADVVRRGEMVTLVTVFTRRQAVEAARALEEDGISVEIIDPLTLVPLDLDTILTSVRKTGRLVIADIAHDTGSAASQIAALVAEHGFRDLRAPIRRVCTPDVHIPFARHLESVMYPTAQRITAAVKEIAKEG